MKRNKKILVAAVATIAAMGTASATLAQAPDRQGYRDCLSVFTETDRAEFAHRACCLAYGGDWIESYRGGAAYCSLDVAGIEPGSSGQPQDTSSSYEQVSPSELAQAGGTAGSHEASDATTSVHDSGIGVTPVAGRRG